MKWCYSVLLAVLCSPILGLHNLTYYKDYVILIPTANFIKFDFVERLDVLLLEHRYSVDTAYQIQFVSNFTSSEPNDVDYVLYKKNKTMFHGHANGIQNLAVRWRWLTEMRNCIEIFAHTEGTIDILRTWSDRSENQTAIKYIGLAAKPYTTKPNNSQPHYANESWQIRDAESNDVDLREATKLFHVKLLTAMPESKLIYEIIVTREKDRSCWMYVKKDKEDVACVKILQPRKGIRISWDRNNSVMAIGNEQIPAIMWQDPENKFTEIANVSIWSHNTNVEEMYPITEDTLKTIHQVFPEFIARLTAPKEIAKTENKTNVINEIPWDDNLYLPPSDGWE